MKAAVVKKRGVLEVAEVPTPTPGPGEVLVRVKYCGICGSDVHFYDTDLLKEGQIMGHEYSGVIAELGSGVTGWQVGDPVVSALRRPCGQCVFCVKGLYSKCQGGSPTRITKIKDWGRSYGRIPGAYAEYVALPAWRLLRIPDGVSLREAAIAEPLSVASGGVRQSKIVLGDTVAILGAGPIGLMTLQLVKQAGALDVFVTEPGRARAEAAVKIGATKVLDPREVDVIQEITRLTVIGPDIVFELAAAQSTIEGSSELVRQGGRVVFVGAGFEPMGFVTGDWILREVETVASLGGSLALSLELLKRQRIDVDTLITGVVPLEGIQDAFQALLKPSEHIKILVEP